MKFGGIIPHDKSHFLPLIALHLVLINWQEWHNFPLERFFVLTLWFINSEVKQVMVLRHEVM